jgi:DNA-binding transcriptional LysR family regulator
LGGIFSGATWSRACGTLGARDKENSTKRMDRDMENQRGRPIELRHLRYFITIAEELHFARAAERLQMEQSPLSRAIRELERMLGVRLFERNTRSTRITRAGVVLLDYARRIVSLVGQASTNARSAALGHSKQLRIGVSDCLAYGHIMEALAKYRATDTETSISLQEMPLHQQISWIRDDLLDASISLDGSDRDGISAQAIVRDVICAVVPAAHPLGQAEVLSATDLARCSLILFSAESDLGAGATIDDFVGALGRPHIAFRANSLGTMLTLVALGHGIGIVGSAQMTGIGRRDVLVREISGDMPQLVTYVLHSDCGLSEPLNAFIEFTRKLQAGGDSTCAPC